MATAYLRKQVQDLRDQHLFNNILTIESAIGPEIIIGGKKVLNFCSNNYLGLANNPKLKSAAITAIKKYGIGPAAVRAIAGTTMQNVRKKMGLL